MQKLHLFKKLFIFIVSPLLLVIVFQNCGKVNVDPIQFSSQSTVAMDLQMKAPTSQKWNRRYVFILDMSYSAVSGPCPFDVDVDNTVHGFTGRYVDYDPNFPTESDFNDARFRVVDCSVDTSLPFGAFKLDYAANASPERVPNHKTFKGSDFDGNRFKILKEWVRQMRDSNNDELLQRTQILILPTASGKAFERLMAGYPQPTPQFINVIDPNVDTIINYLSGVHDMAKTKALVSPEERFESDPELNSVKMGTTNYTFAIDKSFQLIDKEMERLARIGELPQTSFKVINFLDQKVNPYQEQIDKALVEFPSCGHCPGALTTAWGPVSNTKLEDADLKLSLIQGLTKYYGAGLIETEFLNLAQNNPISPVLFTARTVAGTQIGSGPEFPNPQKNLVDFLNLKSKERNASSKVIEINSATVPYRIANVNTGITTFKSTHILFFNMNYRLDNNGNPQIDSDGDGVPDVLETQRGLDPALARTNGYCLDSISVEPTLKARCESLAFAGLCNATLDSDGDSLNECDELTIGTDPFDFDTDGDGLPDFIEVVFNTNPLVDDTTRDSNADGTSDFMNLTLGLTPLIKPATISGKNMLHLSINFMNPSIIPDVNLGKVRVDNFQLALENFPLARTLRVGSQANYYNTFYLRNGARGFNPTTSLINPAQNFLRPVKSLGTNNMLALLRIVDPDEPQKVYWEMLNLETNVVGNSTNLGSINVSQFTEMKVVDRVRSSK